VPLLHSLSIHPTPAIRGRIQVPGDKSISHRYALLGAMAHGVTTITNLAPGADVAATVRIAGDLGVHVDRLAERSIRISGHGLTAFRRPDHSLDAANSGTTMRLLTGVLAAAPLTATIVGDASLTRRPMQRVIDPMTAMGAHVESHHGRPPLTIIGSPLRGIDWRMTVPSAQVKSAILLAALSASGATRVHEPAPTRDHTERAFPAFGLAIDVEGSTLGVAGGQRPQAPAMPLVVPGDPSSAAVWACAARVAVDVRSEAAGEPVGTIRVAHGGHAPAEISPDEVPDLIDELPVLAARAALGAGLAVTGAGELRVKESDRISALVRGLRALGVAAEEQPDGFVVDGRTPPGGGEADAASDHRLVMAFALVGLGSRAPVVVHGADAVAVSYPAFAQDLARLAS
jgi:3-phosphoshikimate 1-carboxyvinyltransferase